MPSATPFMSYIPSEEDAKVAKETSRIVAPRLSFTKPLDLRDVTPLKEPAIKIPASAAHLFVQVLDEMSRGNAAKLIPVHGMWRDGLIEAASRSIGFRILRRARS